MQAQKILQLGSHESSRYEELTSFPTNCPICGNRLAAVFSRLDGMPSDLLEVHCNACLLSYQADGEYRAVPTYSWLAKYGFLDKAIPTGVPLMDYPKSHQFSESRAIWAHGTDLNYLTSTES